MKFSVFTAVTPEYGIDEAVKIVKETGYDGIEWRVSAPAPEVKPDNYSYETRYRCYNRANMKWTVIKTGHVYGPGSRLGSLPKHGRDENLIEKIKSGQPLELVGGGHFLQHHNFAPDLAELMLSCIGNPNTYGQIFISGGPRAVEARTYYKVIADILGADLKIKEIPVDSYKNEHPEDLPFLCNRIYDLTKLKKAGVKMPLTTLEEGLKLHVESILKQMNFIYQNELRDSQIPVCRSDFQLNNHSANRCYMGANKPCNSGFPLPFFLWLIGVPM